MAGEIEEPLRLNFQVDSLHSGSISFGRYESEALCWERWSSFSHNRYLEEVEKCSKSGLVTEKKAYFEAHFRKKGFPGQSSPNCNETEYQTRENDISEKMSYDEEIDRVNAETHSEPFDESRDGSVHGIEHEATECEREAFGTSFSDRQIELACDSTNGADCIPEHLKVEEADHAGFGSKSGMEFKENIDGEAGNLDTSHVSNMVIGLLPDHNYLNEENGDARPQDQRGSSPKEEVPSEAEYMKPRSMPRVSLAQSRRYISSKASKGLESKASKRINNVPSRSKEEKKTSKAAAPNKCPMQKTSKYEPGSKTKGIDEKKSAEKESRNRIIVESQSSTLQKVSSRAHQIANRVKPAVGATEPGARQDSSRFSFKSDERAQRRKEFDMKLKGKMHAKEAEMHQLQAKTQENTKGELMQLRKSLNFKAIPMPPFYRGALRESDGNKAIAGNTKPRKLRSKSSSPGIRVSESSPLSVKAGKDRAILITAPPKTTDPPQVSGETSCHSTVTSDSSAGETSNSRPSQAGKSSRVGGKKEQENKKHMSLRKHKIPEGNKIYKGKTVDGKQKTRTGNSVYNSFNSSDL